MKVEVSIIIPTYNEMGNITELVRGVFSVLEKSRIKGEVVIVDDNSPDGTGKIADQLAKKYLIQVIHRKGKLGLGSAFIEGVKKCQGKIIGLMDADLSHPPEVIPKLVLPIKKNEADFVIASRYVKGGGVEVWPLHRRIISSAARGIARPLTSVKDPVSGFFFLRKEVIEKVNLKHKGYKIGLEILVKGKYNSVKEIPYVFRNRWVGKSKFDIKEFMNYIKNVAGLILYKLRHKREMP